MEAANTKLDIDHYNDMAAKNHRGLVPMVFTKTVLPYGAGQVAGFRPEQAKALHDEGTAVPHESVYERGAVEVKGGASIIVNATEDERRRSAVVLPDNPLGLQELERIKLAREIAGVDVASPAAADEVIKTELQRRSLVTPTPAQNAQNIVQAQQVGSGTVPAAGPTVTSQSAPGGKGSKA